MPIVFRDQTQPVAPPPPPPPSMPYSTKELPFGTNRVRPAKVYADGRAGEFLTEDEIAVRAYVQHLERSVAAGEMLPDAPRLPYRAQEFTAGGFGITRQYLAKVFVEESRKFNDGSMSQDECKMWAYLRALEDQIAAKAERKPTIATPKK